jgi:excisionase family DNA binding protein
MAERDPAEETYLTVRQAAEYLHLNEKKIYALIQEGQIPATRATGKWLFPRALLDQWLLETAHGGALSDRLIVAGSDDPLLAHAISRLAAEVGAEGLIAYCPGGTRLGLDKLAQRQASVATIHWGPADAAEGAHARLIAEYPGHGQWVVVQMALREQGVMLRPGLAGFDLHDPGLRWSMRQAGAGSQAFFEAVAGRGGSGFKLAQQAISERDAAFLVRSGAADCAPGTRSAAGEFGLEFVALGSESFDFVLPRQIYFRKLFQQLLEILGSKPLRTLAERLGGYDMGTLGRLRVQ